MQTQTWNKMILILLRNNKRKREKICDHSAAMLPDSDSDGGMGTQTYPVAVDVLFKQINKNLDRFTKWLIRGLQVQTNSCEENGNDEIYDKIFVIIITCSHLVVKA